jgi:molybdopterin/thiamine biosynthesis adenylyltransferase
LDDISGIDPGSLHRFRTGLIERGFEPQGDDPTVWEGPIADCFEGLTDAKVMTIRFTDGWPYRPPKLYVEGIDSDHAMHAGEVCLYLGGDSTLGWITAEGFFSRMEEWATAQGQDFHPTDHLLDSHLYFGQMRDTRLAVADLDDLLAINLNGFGEANGPLFGASNREALHLTTGGTTPQDIPGRWYRRDRPLSSNPHDLESFRSELTRGQRNNFERRLEAVRNGAGPHVFLLLAPRDEELVAALAIIVSLDETSNLEARALELASTSTSVRKLRSGPDQSVLEQKTALVVGVGAIGSHTASQIAQAGFGSIALADSDRMRPGNNVRHLVPASPGALKAQATAREINQRVPWVRVDPLLAASWSPEELRARSSRFDIVIEATGSLAFAEFAAIISAETGTPYVTGALFREGKIMRIRRQVPEVDSPIATRFGDGYPLIPPGEELTVEVGCDAPVNNASPVSVIAAATKLSQVAIDAATGRLDQPEEHLEVLTPLDEAPFDRIGVLT